MTQRSIALRDHEILALLDGRLSMLWRPTRGNTADNGRPAFADDILQVKECWADADCMYQDHVNDVPSVIAYRADKHAIQFNAKSPRAVSKRDLKSWNWDQLKWRSSTSMPAWASRCSLVVEHAEVRRVQSVTEEEARRADFSGQPYAKTSIADAWRDTWDNNPWAWALTVRRA